MKFNRGYFKKTIDALSCVAAIIFVEKEKNTSHADIRRLNPQMGAEKKRVLLFIILLKVKNHLSDLFRNYFGTLYL